MKAQECTLLLLAAGQSKRFGAANKLLADLNGKPVFMHAVTTAASFPFAHKIAIVSSHDPDLIRPLKTAGFKIAFNAAPDEGPGSSLALGAKAICDARGILVMLADMPFVPPAHFKALLRNAIENGIVYSEYDGTFGPPALFAGAAALALKTLNPATGAKALRTRFPSTSIVLGGKFARDIDTPQDLVRKIP